MRLASFSVSNFRSITVAKKITLSDYTVLVGANNEGKSNILHALATGMEVIDNFKFSVRRDRLGRIISAGSSIIGSRLSYNWAQDFPLSKQAKADGGACTEVNFEFHLSEEETIQFQEEVGSKLNGTLPISVYLSRAENRIAISKQGPGGAHLNQKANKVADFVSRKLRFEYIPAVRTSGNAEEVISDLLGREIRTLETNPEYIRALEKVAELQAPILEELSRGVSKTVASFLPSVKSVEIKLPRDNRSRAFIRGIQIEVDDGNKTSLDRKGDGVKSLVALALMRHASSQSISKSATIIAVEEPEAHLHPRAIHELREVLASLSSENQVILTTHSPLFVNPAQLGSTIIVRESKAGPAKDIREIRDLLGVRLGDNLQSARLVAIVEGDEDIRILSALIKSDFPNLSKAINSGDLVFDAMGGASNLSYKVRLFRSSATLVHCLLDDDAAGRKAVEAAINDRALGVADYNLAAIPGMPESELEDMLDATVYSTEFISEFGVDPTIRVPAAKKKKWSDAIGMAFRASGKIWDSSVEMRVKFWVADYAIRSGKSAFVEARLTAVQTFLTSLERKLNLS